MRLEAHTVTRAQPRAETSCVAEDGVQEASATRRLDGVLRNVEEPRVELRGRQNGEVDRVGAVVANRVPMPVVVEARARRACDQRAEATWLRAVEALVTRHVLIDARAQRGERVARMIEALGTDPVAGQRVHEAAHVPVALTCRRRRHLGVRLQARRDAHAVAHQGSEEGCRGEAFPSRRGRPFVGVSRLLRAVSGVPGEAVRPEEDPEPGAAVGAVGERARGLQHRVERGQGEGDGGSADGAAKEGSAAEELAGHSPASGSATVRNASLVANATSKSRKRYPLAANAFSRSTSASVSRRSSRRPIAWR